MKVEKVTEAITVQEAVDILQALYSVQEIGNLEFAKRVVASTSSIEKVLKPLDETMRPSKEFEELAKLVNEAQGDDAKIQELEEKNEALVDERKKQIEAVKDMLEDTITVDLTYIGEDVLPKTLNAKQLKGLQRLIL
jgi:primosomal protein N''|tara:strand:- start:2639 stop:3049 length:411 start_codon:yes stop_codon:yes gene_type:complete